MKKIKIAILVFVTILNVSCSHAKETSGSFVDPPVSVLNLTTSTAELAIEYDSPFRRAEILAEQATIDDGVDNSWALFIINAKNPLPPEYAPSLASIGSYEGSERFFDARASDYAILMMEAAFNDDITLIPVSSYRSIERQTINFENYFNNLISEGYLQDDAFDYVSSQIAIPNTSEHNAGLAIDFNIIEEWFDQTLEFNWLQENAYRFGFILRYPKGTTDITQIIYEPWHFRFVGLYHAERIYNLGVTLEEYVGVCNNDNSTIVAFKQELFSH